MPIPRATLRSTSISVLACALLASPAVADPGAEPEPGEYETYEVEGVVYTVPAGDLSKTSEMLREGEVPNAAVAALIEEHHRGASVVDVGAHVGSVSLRAARLVSEGAQVIAFEPGREVAAALRRAKEANGFDHLVIHEVALADRKGTAHFEKRERSGQGRVRFEEDERSTYEVPIDRLDSFELPEVGFLKIDAEGHDVDIVEGALELIRRDRPVMLIEFLWESDWRGGRSRDEAIAYVEGLGYRATPAPGMGETDLLFLPLETTSDPG